VRGGGRAVDAGVGGFGPINTSVLAPFQSPLILGF
jgi:hypothetical protein